MRKILIAILFMVVAFGVVATQTPKAEATFEIPKITICHTPPAVDETKEVSIASLFGHLGHGDYLGACLPPVEEPTDYCDTVEGVQPEDYDCPAAEETPTLTPTPPVEETPCTENCGNPPTFAGSSTNAPAAATCNIPFDAPNLISIVASNGGKTVSWWESEDDNRVGKQAIVFGYSANNLFMGQDNLPKNLNPDASGINHYTILGTDTSKELFVQVWAMTPDCAERSNTGSL